LYVRISLCVRTFLLEFVIDLPDLIYANR